MKISNHSIFHLGKKCDLYDIFGLMWKKVNKSAGYGGLFIWPRRTSCAGQVLFISGTLAHDLSFYTTCSCCPAHAGLVTLSNKFMSHRRYVLIYLEKVNYRVGYRGLFHLVGPLAPDKYYLFRVPYVSFTHDLSFCTSCCPAHAGLVTLFHPF